ncbi:FecCD family ABC transporter permease [Pseudonocardia abyssalis]|uniref:Iron chelate uptake ABC transporter family permease subunit n=1 Tax=Pseudonocardia abyssalis TaxID=2792008 RepID=A0ABS6UNP0_9PSEU|nr:iron chelate uptake ABC transporter family permease subunit [Pseudonocardia abyssalis]MBW0133513.1 iron chelate uptake ABC transporter family permease subunit [Pseudonocardia abyssalis]
MVSAAQHSAPEETPLSTVTPVPATATGRPPGPRRSLRGRRLVGLALLLVALVAGALLSVAVGAKPIPLDVVWDALVRPDLTLEDHIVVRSLRIPRTVLGLVAGAALGLSGALIQGHTRNPLADPGLLGINAGAAFLVVLGIYVFSVTDPLGYVWFAFAGAAAASVAVFVLGSVGRGGATPVTLALAGSAISALLGALTSAVILIDVAALDAYRFWAVGSLAGRDGEVLTNVVWFLAAGAVLALASAPALNALSLGDDVARSLGHSVRRTRILGTVAITLLAGGATAACGPIAFVGLVVPHIVRTFTGPDYRWLLPASALSGSVLLLVGDVLGRVLVRPGELQVGIVLALVGAPFFIYLVRRRKMVDI